MHAQAHINDHVQDRPAPSLPQTSHADRASRPLRFITCGNVDDGKSTLIGRLLWDTKMVMSDHVEGLYTNNRRDKNGLDLPDFSLLLDGLQAEREQGITIDVAYRYFSTANRSYIVADTPGHEQYTGNMATGASTADLAIILVDARAGLQEQTRRHAMITSLMGIRQVILVVNKMDLVGFRPDKYEAIRDQFYALTRALSLDEITVIPSCAPTGENVTVPGTAKMPWYLGPTLLDALEQAPIRTDHNSAFRFSVQRVARPDESFRGYQGTVSGDTVYIGDKVSVAPHQEHATITGIVTFDGEKDHATPGQAVTLVLDRNIDIARGDMITSAQQPPATVRSAEAKLVVLTPQSLDPAKRYWLKSGSRRQRVHIQAQANLDLATMEWSDATMLTHNTIATVALRFEEDAIFDLYGTNRTTGSFVLIDPDSLNTVAGGMITDVYGSVEKREAKEETVTISLPLTLAKQLAGDERLAAHLQTIEILNMPGHHIGKANANLSALVDMTHPSQQSPT